MALSNKHFRHTIISGLARLGLLVSGLVLVQSSYAKTILILGDSISAGYGINVEQGWVKQLQQRLNQKFPKQHQVVNASVSGETTSGGLARLPKLINTYKPDIIVIELGGNDALRGQPPAGIQANLNRLVTLTKQANAKVVLLGMKIPPNYGQAYNKAFEQTFSAVAKQQQVSVIPFFLEGIAGNTTLMQADLIHPTQAAQTRLLDNAWPVIQQQLTQQSTVSIKNNRPAIK